jgi:hypothetical protein
MRQNKAKIAIADHLCCFAKNCEKTGIIFFSRLNDDADTSLQ